MSSGCATLRVKALAYGAAEQNVTVTDCHSQSASVALNLFVYMDNGIYSLFPTVPESMVYVRIGDTVNGKVTLRVTNAAGKQVMEKTCDTAQLDPVKRTVMLDVSRLSPGVYTVALTNNGKDWLVGLGVSNLGRYSYAGHSGALSARLGTGGRIGFDVARGQRLELTADGGLYLSAGNAKSSAELAGGAGYTFLSNYTLRAGAHTGSGDNFFTAGASVVVGRFTVDCGMKIAATHGSHNMYMVGVAADL